MRVISFSLLSLGLSCALIFPFELVADEPAAEESIPAHEQAADNLSSLRRYIDRVRSLERQHPSRSGSRSRQGQQAQYEWQQQSYWLQTQRNLAEKLSWELQQALADYEPIYDEEDVVLLNAQYEALKAQLNSAGKGYRVRYDGPRRRQRGYKAALRQLR